jgi:hypothetical protein
MPEPVLYKCEVCFDTGLVAKGDRIAETGADVEYCYDACKFCEIGTQMAYDLHILRREPMEPGNATNWLLRSERAE